MISTASSPARTEEGEDCPESARRFWPALGFGRDRALW
jgi:hypothetical protein